jgi:hypothetical protein
VFACKSRAAHVDAADEDSGYILSIVFDGSNLSSNLAIFDAKDIARGPISRVKLPYALAFGQRGQFIPNLVFDFDEVQRRWKVSADNLLINMLLTSPAGLQRAREQVVE